MSATEDSVAPVEEDRSAATPTHGESAVAVALPAALGGPSDFVTTVCTLVILPYTVLRGVLCLDYNGGARLRWASRCEDAPHTVTVLSYLFQILTTCGSAVVGVAGGARTPLLCVYVAVQACQPLAVLFVRAPLALPAFGLKSSGESASPCKLPYSVLLLLLVETIQLSSLAFAALGWEDNSFKYAVLDVDYSPAFHILFWLACVISLVLPVLTAYQWLRRASGCADHTTLPISRVHAGEGGLLAMPPTVSSICFVTATVTLLRGVVCKEGALQADRSIECGSAHHVVMVVFGLISLGHLFVTASLLHPLVALDLQDLNKDTPIIAPEFAGVEKACKLVLCGAAVVFEGARAVILAIFAVGGVLLLLCLHPHPFLRQTAHPASPNSLSSLLRLSTGFVLWAVTAALFSTLFDLEMWWERLALVLAGWLFGAAAYWFQSACLCPSGDSDDATSVKLDMQSRGHSRAQTPVEQAIPMSPAVAPSDLSDESKWQMVGLAEDDRSPAESVNPLRNLHPSPASVPRHDSTDLLPRSRSPASQEGCMEEASTVSSMGSLCELRSSAAPLPCTPPLPEPPNTQPPPSVLTEPSLALSCTGNRDTPPATSHSSPSPRLRDILPAETPVEDDMLRGDGDLLSVPASQAPWMADDEEDDHEYCPGGYHRVQPGDVLHEAYKVVLKLGWGSFSTVWLATEPRTKEYYALKVSKSASVYTQAAKYEIEFLTAIRNHNGAFRDRIVQLVDSFAVEGENGSHTCMVMEAMGPNLLKLVSAHNFEGIAPNIVKAITRHLLSGLVFLHEEMDIIHADLKPENILLVAKEEHILRAMAAGGDANYQIDLDEMDGILSGFPPPPVPNETLENALLRQYTIKITDFGSARWAKLRYPLTAVQTREYRSPENVLGDEHPGTAMDIWSVACIVFELLTGDFLFDPKDSSDGDKDRCHLALFTQLLGDLPRHMTTGPAVFASDFYNARGAPLFDRLPPIKLDIMLRTQYGMSQKEASILSSFLLPMLAYSPAKRTPASRALQHPWLTIACDG